MNQQTLAKKISDVIDGETIDGGYSPERIRTHLDAPATHGETSIVLVSDGQGDYYEVSVRPWPGL